MTRYIRQFSAIFMAVAVFACVSYGQNVVINEFMAVNGGSYTNHLGEFSDWIELYNPSSNSVSLTGWHLTDNSGNLKKWAFPATNIAAYGYLLVFADNKTNSVINGYLHTNFKLDGGGEYLALVKPDGVTITSQYTPAYPDQTDDISFGLRPDTSDTMLITTASLCRFLVPTNGTLGLTWTQPTGFDDSGWNSGLQGIGYETVPGSFSNLIQSTVPIGTTTTYIRVQFTVSNPSVLQALRLKMKYDDGFIVYLNGTAVATMNQPISPDWNTPAAIDNPDEMAVAFEEFDISSYTNKLVAGTNMLAIHIMNAPAPGSMSNLLVVAELTGSTYLPSPSGEQRYFHTPTPGSRNVLGYDDFLQRVSFSVPRGIFYAPFDLTLTAGTPGSTVYYTLTGSEPVTNNRILYTGPMQISTTVVVRARAYMANHEPSETESHTYIFPGNVITSSYMNPAITQDPRYAPHMTNSLLAIPSISIATETDGYSINWSPELRASVEMLATNAGEGFQINCGIARYGNRVTAFEKRQFRLYFRSRYGAGKLEYPLFEGFDHGIKPSESFDQLDFRSGSHDMFYRGFYMSGAFCDDTMIDMGHLNPHGRFVHVYVNGVYWGMYHLHERWEAGTMSEYLGGEEEDYEAVAADNYGGNWLPVMPVDGDGSAWQRIVSLSNNYNAVKGYLNVPQYIDFSLMFVMGNAETEFRAVGPTTVGYGYTLQARDPDGYLRGPAYTVWDTGPSGIMGSLRDAADPDFVVLERDRIYRAFFHDGPLTAVKNRARLLKRCDEIEIAFYSESARWSFRTPDTWASEKTNALNRFYTTESQMIAAFRSAGYYPVEAPEFNKNGGIFTNEFQITMTQTNGKPIYYTLDGSDPRTSGSGVPTGTLYSIAITISNSVLVKARAFVSNTQWSAVHEAVFAKSTPPTVCISEIMYHPRPPESGTVETNYTTSDFEFVELKNNGSETIGLAGLKFVNGLMFDFAGCGVPFLYPGECVLVVNNMSAFTNRYTNWQNMKIAGEFQTLPVSPLSDNGEKIELEDALGSNILSFTYGDGRDWPQAADGAGHSLIPLVQDNSQTNNGLLDYGGNWRASSFMDGSPGTADDEPITDVVLNEIMAHTDYTNELYPEYDSDDWIEIYNTTASPMSLTNWYLSDDAGDLKKWQIPATNTIAGNGWLWFDEITGFHSPITNGFGLFKGGEQVFLSYLPGNDQDRVVDSVTLKGQSREESLGRYPDGDDYWYELALTPGTTNALPGERVVISEIMYHPAPTVNNPEDNTNDEYIELYNQSKNAVTLMWEGGAYRIDGGVEYTFPSNTVMGPGTTILLVSFDPETNLVAKTNFLATYNLQYTPVLMGPYDGKLSNEGERIALEKPQLPDLPGESMSWIIVDEVIYSVYSPWPVGADGTGLPITRLLGIMSGNNPASWTLPLEPSPGVGPSKMVLTRPEYGREYLVPFSLTVHAEVDLYSVSGSVHNVEFFNGINSIYVDTNGVPYECVFSRTNNEGSHTLSAVLTDDGGTFTSAVTVISVVGPMSVYNTGVSNITDISATPNGLFTGEGIDYGTVTLYWGDTDGTSNKGSWAHSEYLGRKYTNGTGGLVVRACPTVGNTLKISELLWKKFGHKEPIWLQSPK